MYVMLYTMPVFTVYITVDSIKDPPFDYYDAIPVC